MRSVANERGHAGAAVISAVQLGRSDRDASLQGGGGRCGTDLPNDLLPFFIPFRHPSVSQSHRGVNVENFSKVLVQQ